MYVHSQYLHHNVESWSLLYYRIKTNITYIVNLFDVNKQSHSFLGRGFNFSFTWAAILSRSFLPCGVSFLPPVAVSFSTSFIPSRDCRTLRATDELPLQKWLGAVPFLLRPSNKCVAFNIIYNQKIWQNHTF